MTDTEGKLKFVSGLSVKKLVPSNVFSRPVWLQAHQCPPIRLHGRPGQQTLCDHERPSFYACLAKGLARGSLRGFGNRCCDHGAVCPVTCSYFSSIHFLFVYVCMTLKLMSFVSSHKSLA